MCSRSSARQATRRRPRSEQPQWQLEPANLLHVEPGPPVQAARARLTGRHLKVGDSDLTPTFTHIDAGTPESVDAQPVAVHTTPPTVGWTTELETGAHGQEQ